MRLAEFEQRIVAAFGPDLKHATPANVREFLDGMQAESWREEKAIFAVQEDGLGTLELRSEEPITYEGIIRNFFARALYADREQALIQLWILALGLAYSGIEDAQADSMNRLFGSEADHTP